MSRENDARWRAHLRRQFWILNARNAIRHKVHKCVTCHRYRAQISSQLISQLPPYRVRETLPFVHSGVDYAGPLEIRRNKGRGSVTYKGYIALFVCMVTNRVE